jgi:putative transposase
VHKPAVIALDERHLLRLLREYVSYYHQDRIHDSLEKDTPDKRAIEPKPAMTAIVTSLPRLGGLHHRYAWRAAA